MIRKSIWIAGTAAGALALALGIGLDVAWRAAPVAEPLDPEIAALLDPARFGRSLCGKQGEDRGLFFRPGFRLALAPAAQAASNPDVPLWEGMGDVSFPISTQNAQAQAYFNQGIALTYGFNHWEAIRAFEKARELDPACAICYWGEALNYGPNINQPMPSSAVEPAFSAISKAQALAGSASEKEQALIAALATRYAPDPDADRAALDAAYADAMAQVHAHYPDDQAIAALYAESLMDLTPWDYWERDFQTPKPHIARGITAINGVLEANPDQAGAIHLYIHLTEASVMPEKAEPYADRLAELIPAAGHLVHMPGHTYFRIGRYLDSLATNVKAIAADEAYLAQVSGSDIYRYGYYPHNVHFVLVSAQMAGDPERALEFARKLDQLIPFEALAAGPLTQPIKVAPYFAYLQFGTADDVAAIPEPPANYPYVKGIWHYVRGSHYAAAGDVAAARAEADAIGALNTEEGLSDLTAEGIPGPDVLRLAELIVRARADRAAGNLEAAVAQLRDAVAMQNDLAYTEPPYWYYPVGQTLGAVLLDMGDAQGAVRAFQNSLVAHPNNAWSLFGLLKAQEAAGDPAAPYTAALLEKATVDPDKITLDQL